MSDWEIKKYISSKREEWDEFIDNSRNSTFLFKRDYMEYHADRFVDSSLMAYRRGKLSAVLPANIDGEILDSHRGLTYGGWVLSPTGLDTTEIFHLWKSWFEYCSSNEIKSIIYKPLPYIYAEMPSEEDRYLLFLSRAELISTNISSAIDLDSNPGYNNLQTRHLKKTPDDFHCDIVQSSDEARIKEFHSLLSDCLNERHGNAPVHTYEELQRLMNLFPEEIVIWGGYKDNSLQAAVCVYETGLCAHCQYIATSKTGREENLLPALFNEMIEYYTEEGCRYFDFGISNEDGGRYLNPGLNRQKTSYGASGVAYLRYEIDVSSALRSLPSALWPPK